MTQTELNADDPKRTTSTYIVELSKHLTNSIKFLRNIGLKLSRIFLHVQDENRQNRTDTGSTILSQACNQSESGQTILSVYQSTNIFDTPDGAEHSHSQKSGDRINKKRNH